MPRISRWKLSGAFTGRATDSTQAASANPSAGGSYVYGRHRLGAWPGFVAGWGFVVGKTASCAAMALTFASYAVPGPWWARRAAAVAAVAALAAVNYRGVSRTAALTRVLVGCTLAALAVAVAATWAGGASLANLGGPAALGHPPGRLLGPDHWRGAKI